jgi:hypothetical protein
MAVWLFLSVYFSFFVFISQDLFLHIENITTKIVKKEKQNGRMNYNGASEFESPSYRPAPWRRAFFNASRTQQERAKWQLPFLYIHVNHYFLISLLLSVFIPPNHNILLNEAKRKIMLTYEKCIEMGNERKGKDCAEMK